jgi:hypothetical protein
MEGLQKNETSHALITSCIETIPNFVKPIQKTAESVEIMPEDKVETIKTEETLAVLENYIVAPEKEEQKTEKKYEEELKTPEDESYKECKSNPVEAAKEDYSAIEEDPEKAISEIVESAISAEREISKFCAEVEKITSPETIEKQIDSLDEIEEEEVEFEDNADDTLYWISVNEFHREQLEKLMVANKRFCSDIVVENNNSTLNQLVENHKSDIEDHRTPLKMSLSFDAPPPLFTAAPPSFQRSLSDVSFMDPRKERLIRNGNSNGFYDKPPVRQYGQFFYDKIHHKEEPYASNFNMNTSYSMYRAQKANNNNNSNNNNNTSQVNQWNPRSNGFEPSIQQPSHVWNHSEHISPALPSFVMDKPPPFSQLPSTTSTPQTAAQVLNNYRAAATVDESFSGFIREKILTSLPPPKTKNLSADPRLNLTLVSEQKIDDSTTPKKKVSASKSSL